jgi:hypothetical protein
MNDKLKCVATVRTSNAPEEIEINSEGLVLNKNFASIWGHQIIKFDLEEYKVHYNESDIENEYDILDLASWELIDGEVMYYPACEDFRQEVAKHQEEQRIADSYPKEFAFLDELRDSGSINMFGCGPYLQREFGIDAKEARDVFMRWSDKCREESK